MLSWFRYDMSAKGSSVRKIGPSMVHDNRQKNLLEVCLAPNNYFSGDSALGRN